MTQPQFLRAQPGQLQLDLQGPRTQPLFLRAQPGQLQLNLQGLRTQPQFLRAQPGQLQLDLQGLRNQPQFLRAQPGQLRQDLQGRLQPLRIQLGLQGLILMLQRKQETQNLATKITCQPPQLEEITLMEQTSPLDN